MNKKCQFCNIKINHSKKASGWICAKCKHSDLKKKYEGLKFGELTIKTYITGKKVEALCSCGKTCYPRLDYLKTTQKDCGHSRNNGAKLRLNGNRNPRYKNDGRDKLFCNPSRYGSWLLNAKNRNLEWKLNPEYLNRLWQKQNGLCFYTGFTLDKQSNSLFTVSLDRIDNSKGYIPGNVCFCCKIVNRMKVNLDVKDFISLCGAVKFNIDNKQQLNNFKLESYMEMKYGQ